MIKLLLEKMGFSDRSVGKKSYMSVLLGRGKKGRKSPFTVERERFERDVRDQFLKLKEKGLGIHVFTL